MCKSADTRTIIDVYFVDVPDDCFDGSEERASYAIYAARENCTVYATPCDWQVIADDGRTVTVQRYRNYSAKYPAEMLEL